MTAGERSDGAVTRALRVLEALAPGPRKLTADPGPAHACPHTSSRAASRAACTAGRSKAISTAIMAMTNIALVRVNFTSSPITDL